jgi:hypothetical protein
MGFRYECSYGDRVFDGYRLPSDIFEQFLLDSGFRWGYTPTRLKYRVDVPEEDATMVCYKMEIDYFAGELDARYVRWEPLDEEGKFKEVVRSAGNLLTLDRIPLAFGALHKDGLYRRFLKWRLENNR